MCCKIYIVFYSIFDCNIIKGVDITSNILPISDLKNYNKVLQVCQIKSPVVLTQKGREKYVLLDIADYERMKASLKLLANLEEGEKSARKEGWFSTDDIETALGI